MAKRGSKKKKMNKGTTTASTRALPLLRRSAGETGTAESKKEVDKFAGAASPLRLRSAGGETGTATKNADTAAAGEMGEEEMAAMGIKNAPAQAPPAQETAGKARIKKETGKKVKETIKKQAAAPPAAQETRKAKEMIKKQAAASAKIAGERAVGSGSGSRSGRKEKESKAMDDGAALRRKAREITKEEEADERLRGEMVSRVRARIRKQQPIESKLDAFSIGVNANVRSYHKLMMKRYRRMKRICCMRLAGAPVTPPTTMGLNDPAAIARPQDVTTFHIVDVVDTDGARVRLLFRDSDLFKDEHIPTFLTPTVPIAYTSGYKNIGRIRVGYPCLHDIFNVISRYTPESAQEQTTERQRILQCAALMLSESQRFGHVQLLVKRQIHKSRSKKITAKQNKKIHSWGSIARYCISHECKEDVLHHLSELIVLFNPNNNKYENYKLVGRRNLLSRAAAAAEEAAGRAAEAAARPSQAVAAEAEAEEEEEEDEDEYEYPWQCKPRAGQELLILLYDKDCVPKAVRSGGHRVRLPPLLQVEDETKQKKKMKKKKNTQHPAVPSSSKNVKALPTASAPPATPMAATQQKNHLKDIEQTQAEEVDEKKNQKNPNTDATIGAPSRGGNQQSQSLVSCDGINLYESDLDSLRGPHWVTDAILGYAFAKFARAYSADDLLLVQPMNTVLLNNEDYVAAEAEYLLLASRRLVLIPVNDNLDFNQAGDGKHWSLLVIHKTNDNGVIQFIHHDSVRSGDYAYNLHAAQKLANVLRGVLPTAGDVINVETPQQTNGNDCAIHVLAAVEVICKWWRANHSGPAGWIRDLDKRISEGTIQQMRASLLQSIESDCQKKKSKGQ